MIHYLRKYLLNTLVSIAIGLMASNSIAGDFAVSPMMIDLEGVERSTHEFAFNIFGKSDTNIKLDLFDMSQLETGYMGFTKSDIENVESMASWVELSDTNFRVRDGETTTITGTINVPSRAAGTYLIGVMVEEDIPEEEQTGISVKIRYAVILNMRVEGSKNRRIKTGFEELVVVEQDDGLYVQGSFTNESTIDDWLVSQVQFRDQDNRLFERVEMKTESAWQRADPASRVFPGATVRVFGRISKPIQAGDFNVLVRNRFAEKSQPVYRDTVRLERSGNQSAIGSETLSPLEGDAATIEVLPGEVPVVIKKNGSSFSSFSIRNNSDVEISIQMPTSIDDGEAQGISDFQFYPETLVIAPSQKSRVVLKQNHIEETDYGNIDFLARLTSGNPAELGQVLMIKTIGAQ